MMDNKTLSDLIGLIYDCAFDASLWPRLLQSLADELDPLLLDMSEQTQTSESIGGVDDADGNKATDISPEFGAGQATANRRPSGAQTALFDLLRSHITKALELNRRMLEAQEEVLEMYDLFARLPLGMMVVDEKGRILTANRHARRILSEEKGLSVQDNVLCAGVPEETRPLRQAIRAAAEDASRAGQTLHLSPCDGAASLSVLIFPFKPNATAAGKTKSRVVVLVAAPGMKIEVSPETLKSFYPLTTAEARLLSALICDRDLNSIAEDFGISKNTARNQLKSIYEKTQTHRQAELVRQIITGPAMLATICGQDKVASPLQLMEGAQGRFFRSERQRHQTLTLPDGRSLGFAQYGRAGGKPVILMHAFNGSRLERHPDETIIERCGIHLVIPDRPGTGLSDYQPDLTFLGFADDVIHLADALELRTFGVIGHSMGAPYALALASRFNARVERVAIVCGMTPFESVWELEGMYLPFRLTLALSKRAKHVLEPLARFIGAHVSQEEYLKDVWRNAPPVDRAVISDPAIRGRIIENARQNERRRQRFMLQEVALASSRWGFEICDIRTPVELWHGEQDRLVPVAMARKIAAKLPECRTHFLPGAGHYLIHHCWKEILLSAVSSDKPN